MAPRSIAVLGGGLTGLSSAFHLARKFPACQINLLEMQPRLGGWVQTKRVDIPAVGTSVVLEGGPRTLQPRGKSVLELINILGLKDKLLRIPNIAASAKARYVYIPPSYNLQLSGLQRLPSSFASFLVSPFAPIFIPGGIRDLFTRWNRSPDKLDESVHSLLSRRFGETIALMLGSALVHGVYAADSRRLSVKAAFPILLAAEERGGGSVVRGLLFSSQKKNQVNESYEFGGLEDYMRNTAVYSFKDGMATLTKAIEDHLMTIPNVNIVKETQILSVNQLDDQSLQITHTSGNPIHTTHAVSALPLLTLHSLLTKSSNANLYLPHLQTNPTSSVQVVNLVFPCPPIDVHPEGFGYLIPRPPSGYPSDLEKSSAGILGTVFDSCSLHEQDTPSTQDYYRAAPYTKLTVMVGGPYPRRPLPEDFSSIANTTAEAPEYIRRILQELQVHLKRDLPNPVYWRVWNNEDCIPTMLPGHVERVRELKSALEKNWGGRLAVVSSGVGGVSVPDCVEAGRQVGSDWEEF
ncbi:protoporphyrinogen oxidase [Crepidotus variabilis]|uniref:Protoporphyrinogen oxidase n=1 Tax=Crepidotus variabilis TaxID=179855 RepID=A0A9P6EIA5_9AGAR|nr:protoporphyrinogen oxidase [Crepidotus variabilis]